VRLRESSITEQRHDCCTPVTHTCCNIHARNMSILQSRRSAHAQHNMIQQAPRCRQDVLRRAAAALPVAQEDCSILNMWNIMIAGHLRCPACCQPSLRRFNQAAPTALRSAAAYPRCGLCDRPTLMSQLWLKRAACSTSKRMALSTTSQVCGTFSTFCRSGLLLGVCQYANSANACSENFEFHVHVQILCLDTMSRVLSDRGVS
jgi:hypothetical protein